MKSKKYFLLILAAVSTTFFLTACGSLFDPHYREPAAYDIGMPEPAKPLPFLLTVQPVTMNGVDRLKMNFRYHNSVFLDEYSRWNGTPGSMMTCFLRLALLSEDKAITPDRKHYRLSCNILEFCVDIEQKKALLYIQYEVMDMNRHQVVCSGILREEAATMIENNQAKPRDPAKRGMVQANAMHNAAVKLTQDLYTILSKLEK